MMTSSSRFQFRFAFLLIGLFFCSLPEQTLLAQSQIAIDSLKQVIATTKSDTTRAMTYGRLSRQYHRIKQLNSGVAAGYQPLRLGAEEWI